MFHLDDPPAVKRLSRTFKHLSTLNINRVSWHQCIVCHIICLPVLTRYCVETTYLIQTIMQKCSVIHLYQISKCIHVLIQPLPIPIIIFSLISIAIYDFKQLTVLTRCTSYTSKSWNVKCLFIFKVRAPSSGVNPGCIQAHLQLHAWMQSLLLALLVLLMTLLFNTGGTRRFFFFLAKQSGRIRGVQPFI